MSNLDLRYFWGLLNLHIIQCIQAHTCPLNIYMCVCILNYWAFKIFSSKTIIDKLEICIVLENEDERCVAPRTRRYRRYQIQRSCSWTRSYSMMLAHPKKEYSILNEWWTQKTNWEGKTAITLVGGETRGPFLAGRWVPKCFAQQIIVAAGLVLCLSLQR